MFSALGDGNVRLVRVVVICRWDLFAAAVAAAVTVPPSDLSAAAQPPDLNSIVVRGDDQIGRFLVQRNGTLAVYFSNATMVGRHWVTARGLRLGDPSRRLYVLYSPRRFTGSWAWLLTRWSRYGDGAYYPGLAAKILHGWVTAFRIRYAAGGD